MRFVTALVLLLALFTSGPLHAEKTSQVSMRPPKTAVGVSGKEVVAGFYRTLEDVMKDGQSLGFQGRFEKLQTAFDKAFNSQDMIRVSYGTSWVKTTPAQKQSLAKAFRMFSIANYASQFKEHNGEVFEVTGEKKGPRDGDMIVETTLQTSSEKVGLNYLMRRNDKGWQIVDVFVNGAISEMATRRSEFSSVVRTGGADALIDLLQKKHQQLSEAS